MVLPREEVDLLRDILHRLIRAGLILTEVQKAILFLQEAMLKDRVVILRVLLIVVLLQRAAADLHTAPDHRTVADHLQDPTHPDHLQDHPHRVLLHQAEVEVVEVELREEDSLKLYRRVKTDHSKNRVQGQFYSKFKSYEKVRYIINSDFINFFRHKSSEY